MKKVGIGFWMINYAPRWEAASKEIDLLYDAFADSPGARVIGLNLRGTLLRLRGGKKYLPLPLALPPSPLPRLLSSSFGVNHVFASAGERLLLPCMDGNNTMLTIAKQSPFEAFERNFARLRRLRYVVAESEQHRDLLLQGGIREEAVKLIYPAAARREYRPAEGHFKILFATSPFQKHALLSRGVYLLVHAARELPDVRFILVWRKSNIAELRHLLQSARVRNVEVRNGYIPDMGAVYDSVHATILPGLSYESLKPAPQSALDSLAHGKPVLVSRPTSIAGIVERNGCGVVFDPRVESLRAAVRLLEKNYAAYQASCHRTVEETFCPRMFVERYRGLYHSILHG